MKIRHYIDAGGAYLGGFDGDGPAGTVEVPSAPTTVRQRWQGDGWSALPGPTVRQQRRGAYIAELGKEPTSDPVEVIGDVLDVVIAELAERGPSQTEEFSDMLRKIAAIKSRHPKS